MSGMDQNDRAYLDARFETVTQEIRGLAGIVTAKHEALEDRVEKVEARTEAAEEGGATKVWASVVAGLAAVASAIATAFATKSGQ